MLCRFKYYNVYTSRICKCFLNLPLPFLLANMAWPSWPDNKFKCSIFFRSYEASWLFNSGTSYWNEFSKQLLPISFENSCRYHKCYYLLFLFGLTVFSVKFWYIYIYIYLIYAQYTPSKKILFIEKSMGKNQSIPSTHGGFRMAFNFIRKSIIFAWSSVHFVSYF